jgi:Fuc2NAc and GlcNAc transferase
MAGESVLTLLTLIFSALVLTLVCCKLVISHAHKWGLIDTPNHRSSHNAPTPRGGGIGLVIAGSLAGLYLLVTSSFNRYAVVVLFISFSVSVVGLQDDRKPISVPLRLGLHIALAALLLVVLGGSVEMQRFVENSVSRTLIYAFLLLVIVWWINLFNFMDGVDGLAGMQTMFMLLAGAGLLVGIRYQVIADPLIAWMLCVAGATAGFLLLNWAPAKIFMGDVGSNYLAFMLLSFGLLSIRNELVSVPTGLAVWAILGAAFATDATITLLTRILTKKRWLEGHSTHIYQRLARRFGSHSRVTLIYLAVNLIWLLPLAFLCTRIPQWAVGFAVTAYLPLIAVAIMMGAGKPDD